MNNNLKLFLLFLSAFFFVSITKFGDWGFVVSIIILIIMCIIVFLFKNKTEENTKRDRKETGSIEIFKEIYSKETSRYNFIIQDYSNNKLKEYSYDTIEKMVKDLKIMINDIITANNEHYGVPTIFINFRDYDRVEYTKTYAPCLDKQFSTIERLEFWEEFNKKT